MILWVVGLVIGWATWRAADMMARHEVAPGPAARSAESGPVLPLTAPAGQPDARAELGEKLYHETRLSSTGKLSCNSCHDLASNGADHVPLSSGPRGPTGLNSPTLFNVAHNTRFFWDGRSTDLHEAVGLAMEAGMGLSPELGTQRLLPDLDWQAAFARAYPDGLTAANLVDSLVAFLLTLDTESRCDRYLKGDPEAMTADEVEGFRLFRTFGCVSCHQGRNIGGNLFQKLGVMEPYFPAGQASDSDLGRFRHTGEATDRYVFRVPSLRNVEKTPPYFHDGSVSTLPEAVQIMARHQLGRQLSHDEQRLLVEYLRSLTGQYRGRPL